MVVPIHVAKLKIGPDVPLFGHLRCNPLLLRGLSEHYDPNSNYRLAGTGWQPVLGPWLCEAIQSLGNIYPNPLPALYQGPTSY
jgi:hypothetical protein